MPAARLALMLLLLFMLPHAYALQPFEVGSSGSQVLDGRHVEYIADLAPGFTANNPRQSGQYAWLSGKQQILDLPATNSPIWLRFSLRNSTTRDTRLFLELANPHLSRAILHASITSDEHRDVETDPTRQRTRQPIDHRHLVFPLEVAAGKTQTYYLELMHDTNFHLPLVIRNEATWTSHALMEYLLFGIGFGIMGLLILITGLYASVRQKKLHAYATGYMASVTFWCAAASGMAAQYLYPEHPALAAFATTTGLTVAMVTGLLLARELSKALAYRPAVDRFMRIVAPLPLLILPAHMLLPEQPVQYTIWALLSCTTILALLSAMPGIHSNGITQRLFLLTAIALPVALLPEALPVTDRLGYGFTAQWGLYLGLLVHLALLVTTLTLLTLVNNRRQQAGQDALVNRLRQVDRIKDQFLANTSHELRTPLNGIIGLSRTLLSGISGQLNTEQYHAQQLIAQSAQRLSRLIDDILDYAQLRRDALKLEISAVKLNQAVGIVTNTLSPLITQKGLHLRNLLSDVYWVKADVNRLQQILYNLLGNAIKFTEQGTIEVSALTHNQAVYLTIRDTGIGISTEEIAHIFDAFRQVDGSLVRNQGGTGLGLSITRKLLELQGGTIEVSSKPGFGTRVTISLPEAGFEEINRHGSQRAPSTAEASLLDAAESGFAPALEMRRLIEITAQTNNPDVVPHAESATILAIDDDPTNLKVLDSILSAHGYHTITATSGKNIDDLVDIENPELVLLDLMLPGTSGYEICRHLRRKYDELTLPIIMVTAKNQTMDLTQAYTCGANDYLTKPFDADELLSRVHAHLQIHRLGNSLKENEALRQEIALRTAAEGKLQTSQAHLLQLLDLNSNPLIGFDIDGDAVYFNRNAAELFGYSREETSDLDLADLFTQDCMERIKETIANATQATRIHLQCRHMDGHDFHRNAIVDRLGSGGITLALEAAGEAASSTADTQHGATASYNPSDSIGGVLEIARSHPELLAGDQDSAQQEPEADDSKQRIRAQVVGVMNAALACWEHDLGRSKLDLAEASRIWPVYIDKSTPTTRTLDKYLRLDSCPKNPRCQRVIDTAEFVLHATEGQHTPGQQRLLRELETFRLLLSGRATAY